jgi:hypothetical protein
MDTKGVPNSKTNWTTDRRIQNQPQPHFRPVYFYCLLSAANTTSELNVWLTVR